jgi:hypothetical protein
MREAFIAPIGIVWLPVYGNRLEEVNKKTPRIKGVAQMGQAERKSLFRVVHIEHLWRYWAVSQRKAEADGSSKSSLILILKWSCLPHSQLLRQNTFVTTLSTNISIA